MEVALTTWQSFCRAWSPRQPGGEDTRFESGGPGIRFPLASGIFRVESYKWLQNWHCNGYPARCLSSWERRLDWLARCQYSVTGWNGKFDLRLLSQCGSTHTCLRRSVPDGRSLCSAYANVNEIPPLWQAIRYVRQCHFFSRSNKQEKIVSSYGRLREGYLSFGSLNIVLACSETATREAMECNRYIPAAVRMS